MTKRQKQFWMAAMLKQERELAEYYLTRQDSPTTVWPPDGSFMRNAFIRGYMVGLNIGRKRAESRPA